jgi:hypothetical protein
MTNAGPSMTGPQVAHRLDVAAAPWRSYLARGYAPQPDDSDASTSA